MKLATHDRHRLRALRRLELPTRPRTPMLPAPLERPLLPLLPSIQSLLANPNPTTKELTMRHVIDLDKLRNNIPHHPTWPTSYDTTDPDEASDCWHALHKWLQTALEGPVSDETTIRAPAAPLNRSDTTQGLPAPNPDTWHADLIHQPGYPLEADPLSALANHHGD